MTHLEELLAAIATLTDDQIEDEIAKEVCRSDGGNATYLAALYETLAVRAKGK